MAASMSRRTTIALVVGALVTLVLLLAMRCSSDPVASDKPTDPNAMSSDAAPLDRRAHRDGVDRDAVANDGDGSASARDGSEGGMVFFSPWGGSSLDQLGHERPQEG